VSPTARIALPFLALGVAGCGSVPLIGGSGSADAPGDVAPADRAGEIAALQARSLEEPENPYWLYRLAELHVADTDPVAAESSLRFALQRNPNHEPSLSLLSKVWWDTGRHDEAVSLLETARSASGGLSPELLTALALHYDALDRPDLAESIAASVEPSADWARDGSALAYVRLRGDGFAQSEAVARRALDADPESAVNHNNYGIAKLYVGDPESARKSFLTAVDLDPSLPGPLYNLAIVERFYRFDDDAARDWFRKYRELSSEDPDGLAELLSVEMANEPSLAEPQETP
jgi:tetratricopeptide (TPR) repeat protein